jgi:hypothetical protein
MLNRNSLLKHIIEGKIEEGIEVTVKQGRRRKWLYVKVKFSRYRPKQALGDPVG